MLLLEILASLDRKASSLVQNCNNETVIKVVSIVLGLPLDRGLSSFLDIIWRYAFVLQFWPMLMLTMYDFDGNSSFSILNWCF